MIKILSLLGVQIFLFTSLSLAEGLKSQKLAVESSAHKLAPVVQALATQTGVAPTGTTIFQSQAPSGVTLWQQFKNKVQNSNLPKLNVQKPGSRLADSDSPKNSTANKQRFKVDNELFKDMLVRLPFVFVISGVVSALALGSGIASGVILITGIVFAVFLLRIPEYEQLARSLKRREKISLMISFSVVLTGILLGNVPVLITGMAFGLFMDSAIKRHVHSLWTGGLSTIVTGLILSNWTAVIVGAILVAFYVAFAPLVRQRLIERNIQKEEMDQELPVAETYEALREAGHKQAFENLVLDRLKLTKISQYKEHRLDLLAWLRKNKTRLGFIADEQVQEFADLVLDSQFEKALQYYQNMHSDTQGVRKGFKKFEANKNHPDPLALTHSLKLLPFYQIRLVVPNLVLKKKNLKMPQQFVDRDLLAQKELILPMDGHLDRKAQTFLRQISAEDLSAVRVQIPYVLLKDYYPKLLAHFEQRRQESLESKATPRVFWFEQSANLEDQYYEVTFRSKSKGKSNNLKSYLKGQESLIKVLLDNVPQKQGLLKENYHPKVHLFDLDYYLNVFAPQQSPNKRRFKHLEDYWHQLVSLINPEEADNFLTLNSQQQSDALDLIEQMRREIITLKPFVSRSFKAQEIELLEHYKRSLQGLKKMISNMNDLDHEALTFIDDGFAFVPELDERVAGEKSYSIAKRVKALVKSNQAA